MRYLHSYGNKEIDEYELVPAECTDTGILVKTKLVGVCRSDINQYLGNEEGVPFGMFGHEGLGQVIDIGKDFASDRNEPVKIGDYVSTWSDPAYADYYTAEPNEFVVVPEAKPEFILQPVACAINIYQQTLKFMKKLDIAEDEILLLGSGFMAVVIGEAAKLDNIKLTVVGRANSDIWDTLGHVRYDTTKDLVAVGKEFKVIIDISSKAENFYHISTDLASHEALIAYAGTPTEDVKTNFFDNCWACHTFIMPSPRNSDFNDSMAKARDMIIDGNLNVSKIWTRGYDRNTEYTKAFEDGANRPVGYLRGYLRF